MGSDERLALAEEYGGGGGGAQFGSGNDGPFAGVTFPLHILPFNSEVLSGDEICVLLGCCSC